MLGIQEAFAFMVSAIACIVVAAPILVVVFLVIWKGK